MTSRPEQGELNPEYVAKAEFNLSRRGYEPAEVRALLREVAQNLVDLRAREAEWAQRLQAAQDAAPAPLTVDDVDEADLTAVLGEKTTQILQSAREAASDIHRRAVEKARGMVDQSTEDTQRIRAEAEGTLRSAKERAEEVERKAEQRSKHLARAAESEAERAKADGELVLRTSRTQASEILADAEASAKATTESAEEHAARSRAKADTLVTTARAEVEQLETETQARVSRLLRETEETVATRHAETAAEVGRLTAAAESDADRMQADAEHRAAATEEAGRERGRQLVAEALGAREQVLRDLARHRRNAQVQLAQLRVGRDRLLEAYAVVRATADQATEEMGGAMSEARLAAEAAAGDLVADETTLSLEQLEAEFGLDRLAEVAVLRGEAPSTDEATDVEVDVTDRADAEEADTDAEMDAEIAEMPELEPGDPAVDPAAASV